MGQGLLRTQSCTVCNNSLQQYSNATGGLQCLTCSPGLIAYALGCRSTVCGDNIIEGYEECDDGNDIPYDG